TLAGRGGRPQAIEKRPGGEKRRPPPRGAGAPPQGHRGAGGEGAANARGTPHPPPPPRGDWARRGHVAMGAGVGHPPPFHSVGEERVAPGPPPLLGEHTIEVASELLGLDVTECRRLIDEKVFY